GGTSAAFAADQYTYVAARPTVTSLNVNTGTINGGTTVTIAGTNFYGATGVSFGAFAASSFVVNSPTQITAVAPVQGAGTVDVTVITAGGSSAASTGDRFTYTSVTPTLTALSVTMGGISGGMPLTISGSNLASATNVSFGGTSASFT